MTTFVTGAPGWLGNHLVEALCKNKREVRCLVLKGIDTSFLKKLSVEIVEGDVADKTTLKNALEDVGTVFHCAGVIHPKRASDFFSINRDGTRNILEASISAGVKRFIYVSSNAAQGFNVNKETLMIEDAPCKPESNYGKSKYLAELAVNQLHKEYGIETVILRPCLFYGPGQPKRMTKLMSMVKNGRPLIFGDGKNLRSMTYLDNMVQALFLAESKKTANGKTYWIADKRPYTTLEILQAIANAVGVKLTPVFLPGFAAKMCEVADNLLGSIGLYSMNLHVVGESVRHIGCSIKKAEEELGYEPKVGLGEGIRKSVEWCKENKLL